MEVTLYMVKRYIPNPKQDEDNFEIHGAYVDHDVAEHERQQCLLMPPSRCVDAAIEEVTVEIPLFVLSAMNADEREHGAQVFLSGDAAINTLRSTATSTFDKARITYGSVDGMRYPEAEAAAFRGDMEDAEESVAAELAGGNYIAYSITEF